MTAEDSSDDLGVRPWRRTGSEVVADCRVFQVRRDRNENPRDRRAHDFYVLEAPDWCNIIPLTETGEVVMIEQYRHGIDHITLEVPGGIIDPGEDAADAAARELFEETGYRAREVVRLGVTHPNPAIQNNHLHSFLAPRVVLEEKPAAHDSTEDTYVRLVPLAEIPRLMAEGAITHSLVVTSFYWLTLRQGELLSR